MLWVTIYMWAILQLVLGNDDAVAYRMMLNMSCTCWSIRLVHSCMHMNGIVSHTRVLGARENEIEREREKHVGRRHTETRYTTVMELDPKRPSLLWFCGIDSRIVV